MSPFRWDVLLVALALMVPVAVTSGSMTVGQLATRMAACLVVATLGMGLLRALSTPAETPLVERDQDDAT